MWGQNVPPRVWQAAYDAHAAEYRDALDPTLAGAVERLVELAGARPPLRLLDLATGTGTVARAAARRGAHVVAVDLSPGMIALARELSPEIDFRLADVASLPFKPREFDAVTCGLSLSHFGDPAEALREVLRVLRPEGRFVASTWGEGSEYPTRPVAKLLDRYAPPVEGLDEEAWLHLETGSELLRRAGFGRVSSTTERFSGRFADPEEALRWSLAWPIGAARRTGLDQEAMDSFLADARRALADADLSWCFAFNFYVAER